MVVGVIRSSDEGCRKMKRKKVDVWFDVYMKGRESFKVEAEGSFMVVLLMLWWLV